jgi:hypothetical protein
MSGKTRWWNPWVAVQHISVPGADSPWARKLAKDMFHGVIMTGKYMNGSIMKVYLFVKFEDILQDKPATCNHFWNEITF